MLGHQFHPELTADDLHRLIDHHATTITDRCGDIAAAHRSVDGHRTELSGDLFALTVLGPARVPGLVSSPGWMPFLANGSGSRPAAPDHRAGPRSRFEV